MTTVTVQEAIEREMAQADDPILEWGSECPAAFDGNGHIVIEIVPVSAGAAVARCCLCGCEARLSVEHPLNVFYAADDGWE